VLAGALWWGPGGSRVRGPVGWAVDPLAADTRRWLVALIVVMGAGIALAVRADISGTTWTPDTERPFSKTLASL
jgi:hypothetical protein